MEKLAYQLPNYRMIKVSFVGATDNLGSRMRVSEVARYNEEKNSFKTFSYDYGIGDIQEQAYRLLSNNGWKVVCRASDKDNYIFLCDNWGDEFLKIKDLKM